MSALGIEQQYLASLSEILAKGKEKHPERKLEAGRKLSHYTKGVSCIQLTHYMDDGFPLFTTKKMGLKTIAVELEGFINGITDKSWYKERGCNIWNEWANPIKVQETALQKELEEREYHGDSSIILSKNTIAKIKEEENDLGPIYGYQWRRFDEQYGKYNGFPVDFADTANGVLHGVDQLKNIVDTLKTNPNDRRMVCSAWNPNQMDIMALPPCHMMWGVSHWDGELDLWWVQRSCDALLGVPYNVASYGLLLKLIANEVGMKANKLVGWMVDYHLYSNQFDAVEELLKREPFPLPKVEITGNKSIFDWTHKDFALRNYTHHPALDKVEVVV